MKKTFLNILFIFFYSFCNAQNVHFESSLQVTFAKAKQENKMVFVEYFNAECPVCKKLEPVFADSTLGRFYNANFINYKLNTENIKKEDSLFIQMTGLKFESVPYFLFFDNEQHFVHYSGTRQDINYLVEAGKTAMDPQNRTAALPGKYDNGDRSIKTLYAYSNLLQLYKNDSLRKVIADELFSVYPKEDLGSEKSYIITKNCVTTIDNGFFLYWINHVEEIKLFEKNAKTAHVTNVLGDILLQSINSKERENWDLSRIKTVKEMILKTGLGEDPNAFFWEQESGLLVKAGRSGEAMQLFREKISKDTSTTAALYEIDHFLELMEGKDNLVMIKPWIDRLLKKSMNKNEKAGLLYTQVLYYVKIKDKKTALKLGRQAIDYYKTNKIDADKLNRLLAAL